MLSRSEFGLLVKGVGVFGHFLNLGKFEVLLGQEIVYGLWVCGINVVDLGEVFLLQKLLVTLLFVHVKCGLLRTWMIGNLTRDIIFAVFWCKCSLAVSFMTRL